jgi:two-component system CheB/CheR fusion protein
MRILIVDDERELGEMLARRLALEGHDVHVSSDGWTAIEMATLVRPDAVLTDLAMPGMDGWQLAARLRESLQPDVPLFIAVSAYQSGEHFALSRAAGIDFHLAKPQYFEQLLQILGRYDANRGTSVQTPRGTAVTLCSE